VKNEEQFGDQICPRCGGTTWNPLVDWRTRVSFSLSHVACATCGLTAVQIGITGTVAPDGIQEHGAHLIVSLTDISIEWLEPDAERGGARITHAPSGIVVEATAYASHSENCRAALQALALQLRERERTSRP
jgi:hypothetical protein